MAVDSRRNEVRYPWIANPEELPDNRKVAFIK